jgi:hypothetical protein
MEKLTRALENWGRWARNRYHQQHCSSIEHRFKSPQEWGDWEHATPGQIPPPIDVLDAVEIQKTIGKLGFQFAWALTFKYCYPSYDKWAAARHCKVYRPERLVKLQRKAEMAVKNTNPSYFDMGYIDSSSTNERISIAHLGTLGRRQGRVFPKAA